MERSNKIAHLFFMMCWLIDRKVVETNRFQCRWLTPHIPALVICRKEGEGYPRFLRYAQTLALLFVGDQYAEPLWEECSLRLSNFSQYDAIVTVARPDVWCEFADSKAVNKAIESEDGILSLNFYEKVAELLPAFRSNPHALYWNHGGDILAADETAANVLADLFDALGYTSVTGTYDDPESDGENYGIWYVNV